MKRDTKKFIFSCLTCVMVVICLLIAIVLLVRCKDEVEVKSDGFFQYIVVTEYNGSLNGYNEPVIAIVGFTASGMKQEVIEIPREIEGKPVRYISYRKKEFFNDNYYHVYSENLRKMYVLDYIESIYFFDGKQVDMMVCANYISPHLIERGSSSFNNIYIYKSLYDSKYHTSSTFSPANIVFMNNYSEEVNGGYYRLDNIKFGEKIPVPPNPIRSGYTFSGWYKEPECQTKWDFEMSPTIEDDTEFRLFANWQTK